MSRFGFEGRLGASRNPRFGRSRDEAPRRRPPPFPSAVSSRTTSGTSPPPAGASCSGSASDPGWRGHWTGVVKSATSCFSRCNADSYSLRIRVRMLVLSSDFEDSSASICAWSRLTRGCSGVSDVLEVRQFTTKVCELLLISSHRALVQHAQRLGRLCHRGPVDRLLGDPVRLCPAKLPPEAEPAFARRCCHLSTSRRAPKRSRSRVTGVRRFRVATSRSCWARAS